MRRLENNGLKKQDNNEVKRNWVKYHEWWNELLNDDIKGKENIIGHFIKLRDDILKNQNDNLFPDTDSFNHEDLKGTPKVLLMNQNLISQTRYTEIKFNDFIVNITQQSARINEERK